MLYMKHPENITLTFTNGILSRVEKRVSLTKTKRFKVKDIQFLHDISKFIKTQRIPMNELMQWITFKNKNISVEVFDADTIKLHNLNL